jgi:preprotein translocase subunit YajC
MILRDISALLAMAPPPSQPGQQAPPGWVQFVPLVLLFVIFYFILIRPQQKKAREHANLLKSLKKGDKVVTSGGIVGIVTGVSEKIVSIRSGDTKVEVLKNAVTEITESASAGAES